MPAPITRYFESAGTDIPLSTRSPLACWYCSLKLPVRRPQVDHRMASRHLELDQEFPGNHVAILLILRQGDILRHGHPAVDVPVEHRGPAFLISQVDVLEPVQVLPPHGIHVAAQK